MQKQESDGSLVTACPTKGKEIQEAGLTSMCFEFYLDDIQEMGVQNVKYFIILKDKMPRSIDTVLRSFEGSLIYLEYVGIHACTYVGV